LHHQPSRTKFDALDPNTYHVKYIELPIIVLPLAGFVKYGIDGCTTINAHVPDTTII